MRDLDYYLHFPCLVIGIDSLPLSLRRSIAQACRGKPISDNHLVQTASVTDLQRSKVYEARCYMLLFMSGHPSSGSPVSFGLISSCNPAFHDLYQ